MTEPVDREPGRGPAKQSRRLRRIAIRMLASLLVMVGLALLLAHTGWAKEKLRARAEDRLARRVNGSVSIGSLDYGFLFRDMQLGDIEIRDRDGRLVIQLATLKLQIARWASLRDGPTIDRLAARDIRVTASIDAQGNNNLRQLFRRRKGASRTWHVRAIEIDSLGLVVTNARANKISLSDLQLHASVRRDKASDLVLDELETDVFVQFGERQSIAGHLSQRGATLHLQGERLDVQLEPLKTKLELTRDGFPTQKTEILLGQSRLSLSPGRVIAQLVDVVVGPLRVGSASLEMATTQGLLEGPQHAALRDISVDPVMLGAILGRDLHVGKAFGQLEIEGQAEAMVVAGSFETPEGHLDIAGKVDATGPHAPVYSFKTTTNIRLDKIGALPRSAMAISSLLPTLFRIDVKGTGFPQLDGRVDLSLEALTHDQSVPVKLLDLRAHMANQSLQLDSLRLNLLGTDLEAGGQMDMGGFGVGAQLTLRGNARQALARLEELGLQVPRGLRLPAELDLSLALRGNVDDRIVVTLAPSETAIAGGKVLVVGQAEFAAAPQGMHFVSARGTMTLRQLKLPGIARLARRRAPFEGTLSGTIELEQEGEKRRLGHSLKIDMPAESLSLEIEGAMVDHRWQGRASARDRGGGPELAWLEGSLPLREGLKLRRGGAIDVRATVPATNLADHIHRLPQEVQATIASLVQDLEGELRIEVDGSLNRPKAHIELAARGRARSSPAVPLALAMHAEVFSDDKGDLHVQPGGALVVMGESRPLATLGGELQVRADRKLPTRERVILGLELNVPTRSLAEFVSWSDAHSARMRTLPGDFGAQLKVENTLADPKWKMSATLAGIANLAGSRSSLVASASADRDGGSLALRYGADEPLVIGVQAQRQGALVAVQVETKAASIRLAELVPSFLAEFVPNFIPLRLGEDARLVSDLGMDASFELGGGKATPLALTLKGATRVELESLALPQTSRTYRNLRVQVEGKADVISATLELQESDSQEPVRRLDFNAKLALRSPAGWGISTVDARIRAHRWLLFGAKLGKMDAPRGTIDADLSLSALLSGDVPVVDITANSLVYSEPEREIFTHGFEHVAPLGDVVFSDESRIAVGKLGPPRAARSSHKTHLWPNRALVRLHLPTPITIAKGPLTLALKGAVELPLGYGDGLSGKVEVVSGTIVLFRQPFYYKEGDISLGAHPMANLYFAGTMPPDVARKLSQKSAGQEVLVHLRPIGGGPVISFLGAGNRDMNEALSLLHTGQPFIRSEPNAVASSTVRAPQLMQPITIAFVKANIPRLDLFDRFGAWSDAYDSSTSYGQLRYLDAEKGLGDGVARLRVIARPEQIGRSISEAHIDYLFVDSQALSLGIGARAGSRLGGGVGLFFEWSSED